MAKRLSSAVLSLSVLLLPLQVGVAGASNGHAIRCEISRIILAVIETPDRAHPYDVVLLLVEKFRALLQVCPDQQLAELCRRLENAVDLRESPYTLLTLLSQTTVAVDEATQGKLQNLPKTKQLCMLSIFSKEIKKSPQGTTKAAAVLLGR